MLNNGFSLLEVWVEDGVCVYIFLNRVKLSWKCLMFGLLSVVFGWFIVLVLDFFGKVFVLLDRVLWVLGWLKFVVGVVMVLMCVVLVVE